MPLATGDPLAPVLLSVIVYFSHWLKLGLTPFRKTTALLLPSPPLLIRSAPQLLAVKRNETPLALRWSALGCGLPQAHRYHFLPPVP
ncbi:hypothetical protein AVEN_31940-1 [Araneus ventricosus]|uniref:Uncharacterized protein n=1 Tax=Araneus ventricosus TaxID=182803 RepID=A0A4Y2X986_ARAVE|nr:hypothetical protein AVEN_31940-1 [Araneus ventricosus]